MSAPLTPDVLERAYSNTRGIVAAVRPDQLDAPTPCISWSVREIINHLVAGSFWFAGAVASGSGPPVADDDFSAGDYLATYDDGIAQSLAAFRAPGALEQTLTLHFGPLPAPTFLALATNDVFAHGWDIAKATGQPTDIDPELATQLLPAARAWIRPEGRGADRAAPFGPERDAPGGSSPADQLAAFLGRAV